MDITTQSGSNISGVVVSEHTAELLKDSLSPNTKAAYRSDLRSLAGWLNSENIDSALPYNPGTVADYISHLDYIDRSIATIRRHVRAVSWLHTVKGFDTPTRSVVVKSVVKALMRRRVANNRPTTSTSKSPATVEVLRALICHCDSDTLTGVRDKALLLVGFAAALRRSELVALQVDDVQITGQGADIKIRSSKTDQYGHGETVSITRGTGITCPVLSLVAWFNQSGVARGAIFRRVRKGGRVQSEALSDRSVADIIKRCCYAAGLNPATYSGHSLRSGMLTSAAESGADLIPLAQHARHKNTATTMHYIRHANRYKNNPTSGLL